MTEVFYCNFVADSFRFQVRVGAQFQKQINPNKVDLIHFIIKFISSDQNLRKRLVTQKMTLTVTVIYIDKLTGEFATEIPLTAGAALAGPELWRHSVYGSPKSVELGLSLLCTLKHQDILVLGSDVITLKTEVTTLLNALDHDETYQHRMGNIIRACELAIAHGAAVWIA